MNIQAYIDSGILEAYVNGSLSEEESRKVDELAEQHPEIRQELLEIQQALAVFAASRRAGPKPPPLTQLMEAAAQAAPQATPEDEGVEDGEEEPLTGRRLWTGYALVAAVALLLGLGMVVGSLFMQLRHLKADMEALRASNEQLKAENAYISQQYQVLRKSPERVEQAAAVMADPGSQQVQLTGLPAAPQAQARIYWHNQRDVYLVVDELPEPPQGHQYQLWAIIDGVSVDAGIFDHHHHMQKLGEITGEVSAFAVTLEEQGGRPVPNLNRMYMKGEVKG